MEILRRNERGHRSTISKHLTRTTLPTRRRREHTHTHARAHTHTHTGWKTRALYSPRIYTCKRMFTPRFQIHVAPRIHHFVSRALVLDILLEEEVIEERKSEERRKERRGDGEERIYPLSVYIVSRPTRARFRLSSRFLSSPPPSRVLSSAKRAEAEPEGKAAAAKRLSIRVKARPSSEAGRRNRGRGRGRGYRSGGRNVVPNRGENIGCLQRGERERERKNRKSPSRVLASH